jgi:hypothetical protein
MPLARSDVPNYIFSSISLIGALTGLFLVYTSYVERRLPWPVALGIAIAFSTSAWCDLILRCSECFRPDEEEDGPLRQAIGAISLLSQLIGGVWIIFVFWVYDLRWSSTCGIILSFGTTSICEFIWVSLVVKMD